MMNAQAVLADHVAEPLQGGRDETWKALNP